MAEKKRAEEEITLGKVARVLLILVLLYIILTPILATSLFYTDVPDGREDLKSKDLAVSIFDEYVVAFVIISLALVSAILGGIYLAKEDKAPRMRRR